MESKRKGAADAAKSPRKSENKDTSFQTRSFGGGWSDQRNQWPALDNEKKSAPPIKQYPTNEYSPPDLTKALKVGGALEILPDYGIIRQDEESLPKNWDDALPKDVYISQSQIRRFDLRPGDIVEGLARVPKEGERYLSLLRVEKVSGTDPEKAKDRPKFDKLTPIFPKKFMRLETDSDTIATRLIDLFAPIGFGQRALIVAPPKAGKTWLLKDIAQGVKKNHKDVELIVALIGERPEEVTDIEGSVDGVVYASNFDQPADEHTRTAEIALEHAKRLAESGKDVVILLDSITRLARAYNTAVPPSGRTLSGGFDPVAIYPPKHFFGAARCFKEGGSLTIVGTSLVETGSRMDEVIFEEFKGTGNMELKLDRKLAQKRIYPAIDIKQSSTRHEELLFSKKELEQIHKLHRMVAMLDEREATDLIMERLKKTKTNKEFLETLHESR